METVVTIKSEQGNQLVVLDRNAALPGRYKVIPKSKIEVTINGIRMAGKEPVRHKPVHLKRQGQDLAIEDERTGATSSTATIWISSARAVHPLRPT